MEEGDEREEEEVQMVVQEEVVPHISMNALTGMNTFQTMRINGRVGSQRIHILVDSGSTHNFLDVTTAKKLRCEVVKIPAFMAAIANGD